MTPDLDPTPGSAEPGTEEFLVEVEAKPPWRKILFLGAVMAVLLGVVYLSPLREHLARARELSETIRELGWIAPMVFCAGVAVLVAAGFPRLLFCVIAGMTLGFWSGLFWTQLGTLTGNYALFLLARRSGGDWVRRLLARRTRLANLIHDEGMLGVILARQLPVPGFLINLALGLVAMRHRDFLIGTAIGQLPEAIPCTLIGAGVLKASFARSAGLIGLAVAFAVLIWLGLKWTLRSRHHPPHSPV